jgi:hypothetical protein
MSERRRYTLINDRDRFFAQRAVKEAPAGYVVEIKPAGRSLLQNDRLHAMLSDISKQVEWYGVKMGVEDWKRIFCAALDGVKVVPGIDPGTFVPIGLRTRDMTKEELGELMTFIESWAAERNVVFKDQREMVA